MPKPTASQTKETAQHVTTRYHQKEKKYLDQENLKDQYLENTWETTKKEKMRIHNTRSWEATATT